MGRVSQRLCFFSCLPVHNQGRAIDFHVGTRIQRLYQRLHIAQQQFLQFRIGNVARGNLQEITRPAAQEVSDHKVRILAHNDPAVGISQGRDIPISGMISFRQVERVLCFMTTSGQDTTQ